jgi:dihydrodipicolinate synthase/N-acetylneuraminate lyase
MPLSTTERIAGILPALPTPMTSRGEVDVKALERLIEHVIRGGVHALWVLGSTSEFPALSAEERKLVVETAVQTAKGRVPIMVGVIDNDPRKILANASAAQSAGATACFLTLPYYFIVDQREAIRYVHEIAAESPLPFILYDNPPSTGIKLTVETLAAMSESPNLIGLKDSTCDFIRLQNCLATLRKQRAFKILQGIDQLVAASLLMGADGAIVALGSIAPALFVNLYDSARVGDMPRLMSLQARVLRLCRLYSLAAELTDGAFFAGIKGALEVLGISGRAVSRPFCEMPKEKMPEVEALLKECGALTG